MATLDKKLIPILLFLAGTMFISAGIAMVSKPNVKYIDYTDEEIKRRARELGMVDIKEVIEKNQSKKEENKDTSNKVEEKVKVEKDKDIVLFEIKKGESSENVIERLFKEGVILDKNEFAKAVFLKKAERRFKYGVFELKKGMDYNTIIDILTGVK
ncbi:YceG-like family protein [Caloranaerobacter azorensis DSM 13643]|uniref:YceG-like family protein n=1 Tax=Caloranaerobacter azorensis DSM 13643 TaxID=1121264 RepID=A0A1M5U0K1_9FIRM|nr:endolytic transglycosylase MltG [Caloranaerobacter azorensis]SHH56411.1 YceG-like family protein [Caloranaerobacter azorensis DSM 13643]